MTDTETDNTIERIIDFLATCGESDIEAGIGYIEGLWGDDGRKTFRLGLQKAINPEKNV